LSDKDGKELAAVLLGKPRNTKNVGGAYAMYARKVGDPQAYEVTGRVYVDGTATNWLDKQVAKLEKSRVRTVLTKHTDGTTLEIHKNVPEDQMFSVTDLPQGEELKWNGVADAVAAALEWLNFEDVAPAGTVDLAGIAPTETIFTTWDGMIVDAKLYEKGADKDAKSYLVLSASFDESQRFKKPAQVGPPTPEKAAADAADAAKSAEQTTDAAKSAEQTADAAKPSTDATKAAADAAKPEEKKDEFVGKSPDEVKKEVDELNARASPWIYVIPAYSASNFKKTMKDLLKDKSAPPPAAAPADDASALTSPLETNSPAKDAGPPSSDQTAEKKSDEAKPPAQDKPAPPAEEPPKKDEKPPANPPSNGG
jgi:hypothetical protein